MSIFKSSLSSAAPLPHFITPALDTKDLIFSVQVTLHESSSVINGKLSPAHRPYEICNCSWAQRIKVLEMAKEIEPDLYRKLFNEKKSIFDSIETGTVESRLKECEEFVMLFKMEARAALVSLSERADRKKNAQTVEDSEYVVKPVEVVKVKSPSVKMTPKEKLIASLVKSGLTPAAAAKMLAEGDDD